VSGLKKGTWLPQEQLGDSRLPARAPARSTEEAHIRKASRKQRLHDRCITHASAILSRTVKNNASGELALISKKKEEQKLRLSTILKKE